MLRSQCIVANLLTPWRLLLQPFPANLMVGCFAIADSSQVIRTDLDNELEGVCLAHCHFVNIDEPDE